jgi:hypothetical protein
MTTGPIQAQNMTPLTVTAAKESKNKKEKPATHAFHKVRDYVQDIKLYKNLPPVVFKTSINKVKRGQGPDKVPFDVFDAQSRDNGEKLMEDLPIILPWLKCGDAS